MNTDDPSIDDSDFYEVIDKETQTSITSFDSKYDSIVNLNRPQLPLPRDIRNIDYNTIPFNFGVIVHDIDSPNTSNRNKSNNEPVDGANLSRKDYCEDVVKTYLKSRPNSCPRSTENLTKNALNISEEEYPDYQPCENISNRKLTMDENKHKNVNSSNSSKGKVNSQDIVNSDTSRITPSCPPLIQDSKSTCDEIRQDKYGKSESEKPSRLTIHKPKQTLSNKRIYGENINNENTKPNSAPPKVESTPAKNMTLYNDMKTDIEETAREKVCEASTASFIGIKAKSPNDNENPTDKSPIIEDSANENSSFIMNAHRRTMATIKSAVGDFFGKMYETTRDAVNVVRIESTRHLGRDVNASDKTDNNQSSPKDAITKIKTNAKDCYGKVCEMSKSTVSLIKSESAKHFGTVESKDSDASRKVKETVSSIKNAAEGCYGKMCEITKDTVNLIKSESMRHLDRFSPKQPDKAEAFKKDVLTKMSNIKKSSEDCYGAVCDATKEAVILIKSESAKQLEKFANRDDNEGGSDNKNFKLSRMFSEDRLKQSTKELDESLSHVTTKIGSAISNLSDYLPDFGNYDKSSPYDTPTPPDEVSNIQHQDMPSMFTSIKSKITGMFGDEDEHIKESESEGSLDSTESVMQQESKGNPNSELKRDSSETDEAVSQEDKINKK